MLSLRKWLKRALHGADPETTQSAEISEINNQTLSDIARGMQHAVNTTQELLEQHFIKQLDRYFDADGNPTMVAFKVSENQVLETPLITLINQTALSLSEMQVEMSIRVRDINAKASPSEAVSTVDDTPFDVSRTSFNVDFAAPREHAQDKTGVVDIVMNFKVDDPPEGVARVIDAFNNRILKRQFTVAS